MAEIVIREPTRDDLPAIDGLYRAVKGRGRPESVTRHRFFDTPWGDSTSLIALDGDMCVSALLIWPAALRVGNEVVLGGQGTDAATHPDYRARPRLFVGLARQAKQLLAERGLYVYYTFPNTRSIKLTKWTGGTYLGEVGTWGVELGGRRRLLRRRRREADGLLAAGSQLPEIAPLAESALGGEAVIRIDKSRTWLDWRYSEATAERYEWLLLEADGSVAAAALVGERDPSSWGPDFAGLLRIHELFALNGEAAEALLRRVVAYAEQWPGARKLDVLVKDPVLERAVEQAGFGRQDTRPVTAFVFREGLPLDPLEFSHWRLISGDVDFF